MPHFNDMVYHSGGVPSGGLLAGGNVFWVDSGASLASDAVTAGKSRDKPFATLDYAIGQCTASNGDVIYLCEGHAENVADAADIVFDVAGVTVIGLGSGALRPTFTFITDAGADIDITAASVTIQNVLFYFNKDGLTNPIHVAAADFSLVNCEFRDASASVQANFGIVGTTAADRLLIDGLIYNGYTAGSGTTSGIRLNGSDNAVIQNSRFYGEFTTGVVEMWSTACTNVTVDNCYMYNESAALSKNVVDTVTGSTYQVYDLFDGKGGYAVSGGSGASGVGGDDVSSVSAGVSTNTSFLTVSSAAVSGLTSSHAIVSGSLSGLTSSAAIESTSLSGLTSSHAVVSGSISGLTSYHVVESGTLSGLTSYHVVVSGSLSGLTSYHVVESGTLSGLTSSHAVVSGSLSGLTSSHAIVSGSLSGLTSSHAIVSATLSEMMSYIVSGW